MKRANNSGFTLIELSIVIVIIGLIVGGVLVGRDLIRAAEIRSQISQIEKYRTSVKTFQLKYNALPGDLTPATATAFGFTTRSGATYHGDGNGIVQGGCYIAALGCETALFWNDLSFANLIEGSFTTATDALVTTDANNPVDKFLPKGKLQGNYVEIEYNAISPLSNVVVNSNVFLLIGDTSFNAGVRSYSNRISPIDAMAIDTKTDDGKPFTGLTFGRWYSAPQAPANGVCVTTGTGNPYNTTTSSYANTPSCYMSFKF